MHEQSACWGYICLVLIDESAVLVSFIYHLQDADTEVTCLIEKHHVANELLKASQKECHELSEKNSKLMFELSHCKSSLKYAERLKEVTFIINYIINHHKQLCLKIY